MNRLLITGAFILATTTVAAAETLPNYRVSSCPADFPLNAICGTLSVVEERTTQQGVVQLPVVRLQPISVDTDATPLVILGAGGPGGGLSLDDGDAIQFFENFHQGVNSGSELILIDQRGAGLAKPNLSCPELTNANKHLLSKPLNPSEEEAIYLPLLQQCKRQLSNAGVNLSAYTTTASADDMEDFRRTLDLPAWNIIGLSYGARLALKLMQRHPDSVRAALLDSLPPFDSAILPPAFPFAAVVKQINRRCQSDDYCRQQNGHVVDNLQTLTERLAKHPVTVNARYNGDTQAIALTPNRLLGIIHFGLYLEQGAAALPALSKALLRNEYDHYLMNDLFLINYLDFIFDEQWSDMLYLHIGCHEDYSVPFRHTAADSLEQYEKKITQSLLKICNTLWPKRQAATLSPVVTDHPIFIVGGELDPATPVAWAQAALARLPNAQLIVTPFSHTPSILFQCIQSSMHDFLVTLDAVKNYCYNKAKLSFF